MRFRLCAPNSQACELDLISAKELWILALGPKLGIPLIAQGKDVAKPKCKSSSLLHLDRDQVASMREELARLVEENGALRRRCEVDIPHWAKQVRAVAIELEEAAEPIVSVPLGARLLTLVDRLQEAEQGLRALRGAPYREVSGLRWCFPLLKELEELKRAFAEHIEEGARRSRRPLRGEGTVANLPCGPPSCPSWASKLES